MRVAIGGDYGFRATPQGGQAADLGYFVEHFGYSAVEALECGTCVLAPLTVTWLAGLAVAVALTRPPLA